MKTIFLAGLLLMVGIPVDQARAGGDFRPSDSEMQQLPPFCAVRFNSSMDSPEWKTWRSQLGGNFLDIHHYCAGLNFLNRYYRVSKAAKSGQLQGAKRNFEYMIKAAGSTFPLRAETYLNHGITMRLMGQQGLAVRDLQQAIEINPKLTKAYQELIYLYRNNKQSTQAMDITIAGLRQIPDSKALQKHYLELGGKQPFPEPIAAAVVQPVVESPPIEAATKQAASVASEQSNPATDTPSGAVKEKPAIGTPGNPYCRFCPPPETAR